MARDTIAAIATARGRGGIGIVRISGPRALEIGAAIFRGRGGRPLASAAPATLQLGTVVDPASGEALDEALAAAMPAGRAFTGEDTVEIQGHGGTAVLEAVLAAALASGARLAGPGEFTRRAFLGGRIDLAQAEAVAELVEAETAEERSAALARLGGATGRAVRDIRERIVGLAARIEAAIDFGEVEGIEELPLAGEYRAACAALRSLVRAGAERRRAARGVRVVLVGRANTGKSSIFNYLCGSTRALVTPRPGTTRDYLEERVVVGGADVVLVDTAGIRETADEVEALGMARSRENAISADLVLMVVDGSASLSADDLELAERLDGKPHFVVVTKADLPQTLGTDPGVSRSASATFRTSVVTGEGFPPLRAALASHAGSQRRNAAVSGLAPNARQSDALDRALRALENAARCATTSAGIDLAAEELRAALKHLDEVAGHGVHGEVLDQVFSRFCIGK